MNTYHERILNIITQAEKQIRLIDSAKLNDKPRLEKWSQKELIGHLIDSAYNNHQRFLRAEEQGNLIFFGYNPDEWVLKNRYQERSLDEIISLWIDTNRHLSKLIGGLSPTLLENKTSNHNFDQICMNLLEAGEPTNLSYLIWDYIFHIEYHLAQIIPNYQKQQGAFV